MEAPLSPEIAKLLISPETAQELNLKLAQNAGNPEPYTITVGSKTFTFTNITITGKKHETKQKIKTK